MSTLTNSLELLRSLFANGGPIMLFIAMVSIVAWTQASYTWLQIGRLSRALKEYSAPLWTTSSRSTLQVSAPGHSEFLGWNGQASRMRRALGLIATLGAVLPLLGLLGTVWGMLMSFEVIHGYGTGQPKRLAGGIGQALLTTQAGLWCAVPILFFHHVLKNRLRLISIEIKVLSHFVQQQTLTPHPRTKGDQHV